MNIIDKLVVTLGLDPSGFKKGATEAGEALDKTRDHAVKAGTHIEDAGKKAAESLHKLKEEILELTAVMLGGYGIKEFIEHIVEGDAALGRLSINTHMSTESLSAWEGSVKRTGGSAQAFDATVKGLVGQFQQFALTGNSAIIPYFRAVGVAISDAQGHMRDVGAILLDLADKFSKMDPAKAQALGRGMGIDEGTINLLIKGRVEVQKMLDAQKALNAVTKEQTAAAQELEEAWRNVTDKMEGIGRSILNFVMPALTGALHLLSEFLNFAGEHLPVTTGLVLALGAAFTGLAGIQFAGLLSGLGALVPAIGAVSGAMAVMMGLLGKAGLVGAAGAVGYGIGSLINEGIEKLLGDSLGGWLHDKLNPGATEPGGSRSAAGRIGSAPAAAKPKQDTGAMFSSIESKYGLPAGVLDAMWKRESNRGDPKFMLSKAGAKGHFGFMDATAKEYNLRDPNDLGQSADAAGRKMRDLLQLHKGNLADALADYNGGGRAVANLHAGHPFKETAGYLSSIMGNYARRNTGGAAAGGNKTVTIDTHIGEVNIQTQATDANGIAKDIASATKGQMAYAAQANSGLQ